MRRGDGGMGGMGGMTMVAIVLMMLVTSQASLMTNSLYKLPVWEFPKIGDLKKAPEIVGPLF